MKVVLLRLAAGQTPFPAADEAAASREKDVYPTPEKQASPQIDGKP